MGRFYKWVMVVAPVLLAMLGCSLLPVDQISGLAEEGQSTVATAQAVATEAAAAEQQESETSAEGSEGESASAPAEPSAGEGESEPPPAAEEQPGAPAEAAVTLDGNVEIPLPAGSTEVFSARTGEGLVASYQTSELTAEQVDAYFRSYFSDNGYELEGEVKTGPMTTLVFIKDALNVAINIDSSGENTQYQLVVTQQ